MNINKMGANLQLCLIGLLFSILNPYFDFDNYYYKLLCLEKARVKIIIEQTKGKKLKN